MYSFVQNFDNPCAVGIIFLEKAQKCIYMNLRKLDLILVHHLDAVSYDQIFEEG